VKKVLLAITRNARRFVAQQAAKYLVVIFTLFAMLSRE
jgi:hypothetical protein